MADALKHNLDRVFELAAVVLATALAVLAVFANPLCRELVDEKHGCGVSLDNAMFYTLAHPHFNNETAKAAWHNPGYIADDARLQRRWFLLGMTLMEADLGRRMTVAVFSGAMIGFERRSADRPAGIRTMSLASLGACLFTICGTWAFTNGWNNWDASRVSAAIPSGVGFLGSGIVWKGQTEEGRHAVRGLTTAASVWISAATGLAAGGGLYFPSIFGSLLSILVLRYGPRLYGHPDYQDNEHDSDSNSSDDATHGNGAEDDNEEEKEVEDDDDGDGLVDLERVRTGSAEPLLQSVSGGQRAPRSYDTVRSVSTERATPPESLARMPSSAASPVASPGSTPPPSSMRHRARSRHSVLDPSV